MADAILVIAEYRQWIFAALGVLALVYFWRLGRARAMLGQTPFGLEREAALTRQNTALAMLAVLAALAIGTQVIQASVAPQLLENRAAASQAAQPTPAASATPILSVAGTLTVDSSGCDNPQATLAEPQPGARISGSYAVRGTAQIENFAFYKFEISGPNTNGVWIPLFVGNTAVVEAELGTFDASAYEAGEYAFRLVVMDSTGAFPPPCVVPVTLVDVGQAPAP